MFKWLLNLLMKAPEVKTPKAPAKVAVAVAIAPRTGEYIPSPSKRAKAIGGVSIAAVAAAALFIAPWEGVRYKAYRDIAGVPTICYGRTKDVKMTDTATPEQCDKWFLEELEEFNRAVRKCLTREPTLNQEVAFVDLAYNTGVTAFCNATYLKKFNAGDDYAACEGLLAWDKVRINGQLQRIDWQVRRRNAGAALCKQE